MAFINKLAKKTFDFIGLDIIRKTNSPRHNLLGLKRLPIHTIIDIGANKGQFAEMISGVFPTAAIYSFEPLPAPFKALSKWAESKNIRVKAYNIAIGDRKGEVKMFYHYDHSPSSSILKSTKACEALYPFTKKQTTINVKVETLDEIVAEFTPLIPQILIKLDVQGYEAKVIKGGTETFRRAKACILEASMVKLYENQASFKEILLLLSDLNYYYAGNLNQTYSSDGHVIFIDALFLK